MSDSTERTDPLRRRVAWTVFLGAASAVLLGQITLWIGLTASLVVAFLLSYLLSRELRPLRQRLAAASITGEEREPTPGEMAIILDRANERANESRDALLVERDDLVDILHATSNGLVLLDKDERILLLNDAARRMLGSTSDPLGRRLTHLTRNLDLLQVVERARAGVVLDPQRVEVHAESGRRSLRVAASLLPERELGANQWRVVLVLVDISDLQHLERVRTDFVANVTHEMRSPLAAIVGFGETMTDETDGFSEVAKRCLDRILTNSHRLTNILDDLVRLSRLENAGDVQHEAIDLRAKLESICTSFRELSDDKHQTLRLDHEALPSRLSVDAALLEQAIKNLLDNAIKYTPEGGTVAVEARVVERTLTIDVSDDGPGIPLEHQQRIFERFYRVDSARSRAVGGTGLGLAIVKHAAALHGGQVVLESRPGAGTRFSLRIPLEEWR
ncbi:Alkaline phosphatase synthesis sensor protein PhoR [Planctomycetes bacterium Pla163]|uniref:histidine kinase n=1 Tax=Rohdeia mirabilis TaxID=2528008 RepID=A0A518CWG9_9BACT|nr:Alkaline phosphatase synthesis sensor protein PhoR [Planctomycetes bacterium Pla163]